MPTYIDGRMVALCNGPGCQAGYNKASRSGPADPLYHFCSKQCLRRFSVAHPRSPFAHPVKIRPRAVSARQVDGALCNPLLDWLFFPETHQPSEHAMAKRLCGECPVFKACNDYAMSHDVYGIWAGKTREDRNREHGRPSHPERAA